MFQLTQSKTKDEKNLGHLFIVPYNLMLVHAGLYCRWGVWSGFSYEKQLKDTIVNRGDVFSFKRASTQCNWIDTLHFFNQGKRYVNNSIWEAIGPKTETQGVLIMWFKLSLLTSTWPVQVWTWNKRSAVL